METYDALAQFCADQFARFDPQQWLKRIPVDGRLLALAAKYLSMTSWYGYEEHLESIAAQADEMTASAVGFNSESQALGFDLASFSISVRCAIAARQKKCPAPCRQSCTSAQAPGCSYAGANASEERKHRAHEGTTDLPLPLHEQPVSVALA